ncbi:MAG: peptidase [Marivibrio sp.]|uniref:peptidase n=1 Tax=Marivibrio sp. TaxID=2039719 RepID=UPI0032EB3DBF
MSVLDAGIDGTAPDSVARAPTADEGPIALPPLREDLRLLPAAADRDGAPGWTIFDPVRNRYFRIGHAAYEMLRRWRLRRSDRLVAAVAAETVLTPEEADVAALVLFLRANGLVQRSEPEVAAEFARVDKAGRPTWWKWVVHNYLFVRIPLVRPDRFLAATQPVADLVASRPVQGAILALGALGVVLALRQWDQFLTTFMAFANWQGVVWAAVTLTAAKILHELAHAYTARRYGCRVPTMGVAFLVLYPVLYTDTSDSWRLTSRGRRLRVGAAGIRLELMLALLATLLWSLLPEGPARSAVFLIATATWISTLLINLNPFLRFDGYYLLSDWLDVPNLQPRAFALTRWRLREALFGLGLPAPEPMEAGLRRALILYGLATWIYRFFLFIGIALIVYHLFFKTLGILLFVIEIVWFILLPIAKEVKAWMTLRERFRANRQLAATSAVAVAGLWLLFQPWDTVIRAPAVWEAESAAPVLTALPGRLASIEAAPGAVVTEGEPLYRFRSPDMDAAARLAEAGLAVAEIRLEQARADRQSAGVVRSLEQEVARIKARLDRIEARAARLVVRAPISGVLRDAPADLVVGRWMAPQSPLGLVTSESGKLTAYVGQQDLQRVEEGAPAVFYPEDPGLPERQASVRTVDRLGASRLEGGYLAAPLGGRIEARADASGAWTPLGAVYRVVADPDEPGAPPKTTRGLLHLDGPAESWAERIWRRAAALLIRESGF